MYRTFAYFLKAFLSLIRDKYLALYWRFFVRISFILLLIEWSELDPNVKRNRPWLKLLTERTTILS